MLSEWLKKKTCATFSANLMWNQNQTRLARPHSPELHISYVHSFWLDYGIVTDLSLVLVSRPSIENCSKHPFKVHDSNKTLSWNKSYLYYRQVLFQQNFPNLSSRSLANACASLPWSGRSRHRNDIVLWASPCSCYRRTLYGCVSWGERVDQTGCRTRHTWKDADGRAESWYA